MAEHLTPEIAAIHAYEQKHSTCDIQQHPWSAVFGAGFDAGRDWQAANASAQLAKAREALEKLGPVIMPNDNGYTRCLACGGSWHTGDYKGEMGVHSPKCPFRLALAALPAPTGGTDV